MPALYLCSGHSPAEENVRSGLSSDEARSGSGYCAVPVLYWLLELLTECSLPGHCTASCIILIFSARHRSYNYNYSTVCSAVLHGHSGLHLDPELASLETRARPGREERAEGQGGGIVPMAELRMNDRGSGTALAPWGLL